MPPLFPIPINHLCLFMIHLHNLNLSPATIRTYLSAISFVHKLHQQPDPSSTYVIGKTLQGIRNQQQTPQPQLLPITKPILHTLVAALPFAVRDHFQLLLWRSIFLLTFHGCLRAGEVTLACNRAHVIQLDQVTITSQSITITFRSYKHSRGTTPTIVINATGTHSTCPVVALQKYLHARGPSPGHLYTHQDSSTPTRSQFSTVLKTTATLSSLPAERYNTHSFRAGRATQMASDGLSDQVIRSAGRWKSTAYQRYIRPTDVTLPS